MKMINSFIKISGSNPKIVDWNSIVESTVYKWTSFNGVETFGIQPSFDTIIHISKLKKGEKIKLHTHPLIFKKMICLKGKVLFNQSRILNPGDFEKIANDYLHEIEAIEDSELLTTFYKKYKKD